MTQQSLDGRTEEQGKRRGRGPNKPYPAMSFESALSLPRSIIEHGVNGEIQRLTLFAKLNRSPDSGPSRNLMTSSGKYKLTEGSHNTASLKVTPNGRFILALDSSRQEVIGKQFQLAIRQFEPFNSVYEKLRNQKLPDYTVLGDEFGRVEVAEADRANAAEIFTANLRYLGLIYDVAGQDYVRTIEEIAGELPERTESGLSDSTGNEPPADTHPSLQGNGNLTGPTKQPGLHIDIQVHIDSTASAEQIDLIFASMAKHLYGINA